MLIQSLTTRTRLFHHALVILIIDHSISAHSISFLHLVNHFHFILIFYNHPSDSCSCSSRDPSPCNRGGPPAAPENYRPAIRRQSTTEEILIARGFRRQSTTEEMIRCRNFRRQSSQSDDCQRYRGRRDSSTQILDGTIASMTVETSSTFFDSSTQTGKGVTER